MWVGHVGMNIEIEWKYKLCFYDDGYHGWASSEANDALWELTHRHHKSPVDNNV